MTNTICVVTGSRAEYGLLEPIMRRVRDDGDLRLQVVATGMHLAPEFGLTYRAIEADGFVIDRKLDILLSSDSAAGVAKAIGLGVLAFTDALEQLAPDVVLVLGDRFEIFAAAQAAMVLHIPIAHVGGGDIGAGTYDNIFRPCVTLMSHLHFVTHEEARQRVLRLGVRSDRVFPVGATSTDNIIALPLLSWEALEDALGAKLRKPMLLVTFHPLTLEQEDNDQQLRQLLSALDVIASRHQASLVITKPNADSGGRAMGALIEEHARDRANYHVFDSLGQLRYLSALKHAAAVVGNSSSGIYEAPYLQTPTVDIGIRQRGRAAPSSVLRCNPTTDEIVATIERALKFEFRDVRMIYGDGHAAEAIVSQLKRLLAVETVVSPSSTES